jgi:hypothetical protein
MPQFPRMSFARIALRTAAYLWASPNSGLGVLIGLVMLCSGGRARYHAGTAEFSGGAAGRLVERLPARCRFSAITFGHVILAISESQLAGVRGHEHVHVRQYERWGPFFLPAYLLSSAWQLLCGRCMYRDNMFEVAAYAVELSPGSGSLQGARDSSSALYRDRPGDSFHHHV